MPQLDSVTFFSQFFWLCVFFIGFYLTLTKYYLPRLSRLLKVRKQRMGTSTGSVSLIQKETVAVKEAATDLLVKACQTTQQGLTNGFTASANWSEQSLISTNSNEFRSMNQVYMDSLSHMRRDHMRVHQVVKAVLPPQSHLVAGVVSTQSLPLTEKWYSSTLISTLVR
jgi:hypothetical protein